MYSFLFSLAVFNLRTLRKTVELVADRMHEFEELINHHLGPSEDYE